MRRCHSDAMQDYRRENNQEMWDRPGGLDLSGWPPCRASVARYNLECRLKQAVMLYLDELEVGQ